MAKTAKYEDSRLLEAVNRYAETHPGKIKVTELAEWAGKNVPGLDGVRDYHFLRQAVKTDPKTGKQEKIDRACTIRIEQINIDRSTQLAIKRNPLISDSDVDAFFKLDRPEQRQCILDTRKCIAELLSRNTYLETANRALKAENGRLDADIEAGYAKITEIREKQGQLERICKQIIKVADEEKRREVLISMGIGENFDLNKCVKSMTIGENEIFSIKRSVEKASDVSDGFVDELFNGIDPGEG